MAEQISMMEKIEMLAVLCLIVTLMLCNNLRIKGSDQSKNMRVKNVKYYLIELKTVIK